MGFGIRPGEATHSVCVGPWPLSGRVDDGRTGDLQPGKAVLPNRLDGGPGQFVGNAVLLEPAETVDRLKNTHLDCVAGSVAACAGGDDHACLVDGPPG